MRSEDQGWYECKVLMLDQQYDTFHNGSWVHLTVNGESWLEAQGGLGVRGQLCIQSLLALVSLLCPGDGPWDKILWDVAPLESTIVLGAGWG